jgi:hypothetical protein
MVMYPSSILVAQGSPAVAQGSPAVAHTQGVHLEEDLHSFLPLLGVEPDPVVLHHHDPSRNRHFLYHPNHPNRQFHHQLGENPLLLVNLEQLRSLHLEDLLLLLV